MLCYDAIIKSDIKFSNINWRKGTQYIAMNMDATEARISLLRRVLPRRLTRKGSRPWVTGRMVGEQNN